MWTCLADKRVVDSWWGSSDDVFDNTVFLVLLCYWRLAWRKYLSLKARLNNPLNYPKQQLTKWNSDSKNFRGIEWLPPEVLQELLTIHEDLELKAESTSTRSQITKPTESANMIVARTSECSDIGMNTAKTLEDIDATEGKLSVYGKVDQEV